MVKYESKLIQECQLRCILASKIKTFRKRINSLVHFSFFIFAKSWLSGFQLFINREKKNAILGTLRYTHTTKAFCFILLILIFLPVLKYLPLYKISNRWNKWKVGLFGHYFRFCFSWSHFPGFSWIYLQKRLFEIW